MFIIIAFVLISSFLFLYSAFYLWRKTARQQLHQKQPPLDHLGVVLLDTIPN